MDIQKYKTCSLFGHRKIINADSLCERLHKELECLVKNGCSKFLVGNYGDFDKLVLKILKELKKIYEIDIFVVFSFVQDLIKNKSGYSKIDMYKDVNTMFYPLEDVHYKKKIVESNRCMVNDSDVIICYVDESRVMSGALRAIKYARTKNIKIVNIYV